MVIIPIKQLAVKIPLVRIFVLEKVQTTTKIEKAILILKIIILFNAMHCKNNVLNAFSLLFCSLY